MELFYLSTTHLIRLQRGPIIDAIGKRDKVGMLLEARIGLRTIQPSHAQFVQLFIVALGIPTLELELLFHLLHLLLLCRRITLLSEKCLLDVIEVRSATRPLLLAGVPCQ